MIEKRKIKVLVVDDSALIRQTLSKVLSSLPGIEVIATASDPYVAVQKIKTEKPDVITLDIQMPRMDGLTFLKKIMSQHPIPVVVISSLTKKESQIALDAYNYGAICVLEKPAMNNELLHEQWKRELHEAIETADNSKASSKLMKSYTNVSYIKENEAIDRPKSKVCKSIILIGSSAGGTEVIHSILSQLNENTAPILIVQHMPEIFTTSYAQRLNEGSRLEVKEAQVGDVIRMGRVLLAPGDYHMEIRNNGFDYFVDLNKKEKVNRHRPSVDILFSSALPLSGINIMAIILSGMGSDGAGAMLELKKSGAITIAQSEESAIVYGMPKEAVRLGAADYSLSIENIVDRIKKFPI